MIDDKYSVFLVTLPFPKFSTEYLLLSWEFTLHPNLRVIPNPSFLPFLGPSYPVPPSLVFIQSVLGWVPALQLITN